jgi:hypothetical protein
VGARPVALDGGFDEHDARFERLDAEVVLLGKEPVLPDERWDPLGARFDRNDRWPDR